MNLITLSFTKMTEIVNTTRVFDRYSCQGGSSIIFLNSKDITIPSKHIEGLDNLSKKDREEFLIKFYNLIEKKVPDKLDSMIKDIRHVFNIIVDFNIYRLIDEPTKKHVGYKVTPNIKFDTKFDNVRVELDPLEYRFKERVDV